MIFLKGIISGPRLMAKDSPNLGLPDSKHTSQPALRMCNMQSPYGHNVRFGELHVAGVFGALIIVLACLGTVLPPRSGLRSRQDVHPFSTPPADYCNALYSNLALSHPPMTGGVTRALDKDEITKAIVSSDAVQVMHDLVFGEGPAKMVCHDKAMLKNITGSPCVRMPCDRDERVSACRLRNSSAPPGVTPPLGRMSRKVADIHAPAEAPSSGAANRRQFSVTSAFAFHHLSPAYEVRSPGLYWRMVRQQKPSVKENMCNS